jgi:DNA-binding PadR family transcriptional regulator
LSETFIEEARQRFARVFLDVLILKLVQIEPMWGYRIIKETKRMFGVKLRHSALYPLLHSLEVKGFLKSKREVKDGRVRKVYEITSKGIQFIDSYHDFLKEQLQTLKLKE